jgi:hypothetical protein
MIEVFGHQHNLALVLARAGSCPLIDVNVDELNLETCFPTTPENEDAVQELMLVVYKHSGKLRVVVGRNHVSRAVLKNQTTLKARLLTSVALKEARIVEAQPEPVSRVPFNPPRWTDNKRFGANAGPGHERTRTADHIRNDSGRPQHSASRFSNGERTQSFGKPSPTKKRFA